MVAEVRVPSTGESSDKINGGRISGRNGVEGGRRSNHTFSYLTRAVLLSILPDGLLARGI